jgi:hypothetical protein
MKDDRTEAVIAAVVARFPGARVDVARSPNPESAPIPNFVIVWDADRDRLREARDFALERTFAAFRGEPVPYFVVAVTPQTEEQYQRETAAELAQRATA